MGRVLGALVGLALGVTIFWAYLTYTIVTPYDELWIAINTRMPQPAREWSCATVRDRLNKPGVAPLGCETVWRTAI